MLSYQHQGYSTIHHGFPTTQTLYLAKQQGYPLLQHGYPTPGVLFTIHQGYLTIQQAISYHIPGYSFMATSLSDLLDGQILWFYLVHTGKDT